MAGDGIVLEAVNRKIRTIARHLDPAVRHFGGIDRMGVDPGHAIFQPRGEFRCLADILRASDRKLTIEEMTGGTFTISNGGVFGSLLSTPIVNPPQTAILGMHKIQERPMAVNGQVVILPMMYLALSYDHRLIDGKEAVTFLVTMKDLLEDPARLLLDI